MSLYDVSVALHVIAVVAGFGPTFAYPVVQLAAERWDPAALPFALGAILRISRTLAVPGAVLVGLTGAYQVAEGSWSLARDAWLALGVALYVAVFATALGFLVPSLRRAEAEARRMTAAGEPGLSPEYLRAVRPLKLAGGAVGAGVVAIVVLMELKPF